MFPNLICNKVMASSQEWKDTYLYFYEGLPMFKKLPLAVLNKVKMFSFFETDVLISTYQRSGRYLFVLVLDEGYAEVLPMIEACEC